MPSLNTHSAPTKITFANSLSIRITLLLLSVLVIFTVVIYGLVVRPVSIHLAEAQMGMAAQQVDSHLGQIRNNVETTLQTSRNWLQHGYLESNELLQFNALFSSIVAYHPQISSINLAHESGREMLILRRPNGGWVNRLTHPDVWNHRAYWVYWTAEGQFIRAESFASDYDTRKRPWFQGAMAMQEGRIHWTEPYLFYTLKIPGITASTTWRGLDGSRYVMGHDVLLGELSDVTSDLKVGNGVGKVMLFQNNGLILALPNDDRFIEPSAIQVALLQTPAKVGLEGIQIGYNQWQAQGKTQGVASPYSVGRADWYSFFYPIEIGVQKLWVGVFAPQSAFSPIQSNTQLAFISTIVLTLSLGIAMAIRVAQKFAQPLSALEEASVRLGQQDLDKPICIDAPWCEIDTLVQAHETMRQRLIQVRNTLEEAHSELECKVAERTKDLKEAEHTASEARAQAEAASAAKADFLANMSHEIRTPMNAIVGMTHLALQTPLSPKQRNYLEKVEVATQNLLGIVNDILDFSKIEAGMMSIESVDFSLVQVLQNIVDISGYSAQEKGLSLRVEVAPNVPHRLQGDPLRLGQILVNLVGNAIKFTEKGDVLIRITLAMPHLLFEVVDTGLGMEAELCNRLFIPFTQADSSMTRRFGGTGLGLSISKRLVDLMGGEIGVTSTPSVGSTFYFYLPYRAADVDVDVDKDKVTGMADISITRTMPLTIPSVLAGQRVLLVEDNPVNQELGEELLRAAGMTVDCVVNGKEALNALKAVPHTHYAVVLMDCHMPVMDGFETTRQIRSQPQWQHLPILAMTASVLLHDRRLCIEAGMNDIVSKPVNVTELYGKLAAAVEHTTPPLPETARPERPAYPSNHYAVLDSASALARLNHNHPLYSRLLLHFYQDQANSATQIETAWAQNDEVTARRQVHTLKGLASNIGAYQLAEVAAQWETNPNHDTLHELAHWLDEVLLEIDQHIAFSNTTLPEHPPAYYSPQVLPTLHQQRQQLQQLQQLLQEDNADAVQVLEKNQAMLSDVLGVEVFSQLHKMITHYDFESALQELSRAVHSPS